MKQEIFKDRKIIFDFPLAATLFVFLASMAGALKFIPMGPTLNLPYMLHSEVSYLIRFILISLAFLLAFISFALKAGKYNINVTLFAIFWIYCFVNLLNILINPDSLIPGTLQTIGICAWVGLGIIIGNTGKDFKKAISWVVFGYLLANIFYICLTAGLLLIEFESCFHPFNWRFIGPFIGSTAVAEIFFSSLLIGLVFLYIKKPIVGMTIILTSLWAIFATGVRSASLIAIFVSTLSLIHLHKKSAQFRLYGLMTFYLSPIILLGIIFFLAEDGVLRERLAWENMLAEGRIAIWTFGMEEFQKSPFWGAGTRAIFPYGISTQGVVFGETIAWHSTWIAILIENGIIGLVAHLVIILIVGKELLIGLIKWVKNILDESMVIAISAILFFRYIAMSFLEMNLYTILSPGVMYLWIIFGIILTKGSQN
jgi:O-antigen ligase